MMHNYSIKNGIIYMRTTLDIDAKIIDEVMTRTGAKSKSKAVRTVLADWVRRERIAELRSLRGKVDISDDLERIRGMEAHEGIDHV